MQDEDYLAGVELRSVGFEADMLERVVGALYDPGRLVLVHELVIRGLSLVLAAGDHRAVGTGQAVASLREFEHGEVGWEDRFLSELDRAPLNLKGEAGREREISELLRYEELSVFVRGI